MKHHKKYIQRCITLAKNGLGTTYPNPLVGSVVVYNDTIIGEGWHYQAGKPHAEVRAIQAVEDKTLLKKATIYVSLEPCSHFGKTPPCVNLIIQKQIKNVVIGSKDPNPKVSGNGIKRLKEAGCHVIFGILEEECTALNKRFFTFHQKKRPYIILKWAQTQNGYIAPQSKDEIKPVWISNKFSRQLVHKWRAEEQAILVGTKTVLEDNPTLTVRDWTGKNPLRCVLDKNLKIPEDASVFNDNAPTLVFTEKEIKNKPGITFHTIDFSDTKNIAKQLCDVLYKENVQSVILEGGRKTLQTFIDENLWDEARIFTGNSIFKKGVKAPVIKGNRVCSKTIFNDTLVQIRND